MMHKITYKRYCQYVTRNNQRNPFLFHRDITTPDGHFLHSEYYASSDEAYTWFPK